MLLGCFGFLPSFPVFVLDFTSTLFALASQPMVLDSTSAASGAEFRYKCQKTVRLEASRSLRHRR